MECDDIPENHGTAAIKVIAVGGGGNNALNRLIRSGFSCAGFIAADTDLQALNYSRADHRIQLGRAWTKGLGAAGNLKVGCLAAVECMEQIKTAIGKAGALIVVAGMGGGTGSGAAPAIARAAREMGCLTVGVVSIPFHFEDAQRTSIAKAGITALREHVDSLVIFHNSSLLESAPRKPPFAGRLDEANEALSLLVKGTAGLVTARGMADFDCAEVKMFLAGLAWGSGAALTVITGGRIDGEPLPPNDEKEDFYYGPGEFDCAFDALDGSPILSRNIPWFAESGESRSEKPHAEAKIIPFRKKPSEEDNDG